MEGCFLFVAFYDSHQVIHVIEVNLGIDTYLLEKVEKVGYQRK